MNRLNTALIGALLLLSAAAPLAAEPPEKEGINFLHRELTYVTDTSEPVQLPDFKGKESLKEDLKSVDPNGIVELLYTMPLPDVADEDMMLHILQSLSRISTLKGIEYWSGSRQQMYPYLSEAYVVDKKRSSKKQADPVFTSLPAKGESIVIYQEDTTFGKAWYDVTYKVEEDAIRLSMLNATTIRYKGFPVMRKERLRIEMVILPGEENLYFYGVAAFKLGETFGVNIRLNQSFDHRMSSLQTWFSNQTYP
ncbi:MAG: hypothetical protein PQJ58_00610 [Spirochaetales bacterium]|nr:hypothetical protein [Spirochaetales bacterium]